MLLEMLLAIHSGTPAKQSELSILMKPFIKDQLLLSTWQGRNSQWTIFHSFGPVNSITAYQ